MLTPKSLLIEPGERQARWLRQYSGMSSELVVEKSPSSG